MADQDFHEFLYRIEDRTTELAIAILSFGAIFITLYSFFVFPSSQKVTLQSMGVIIEPWITMLALMIIARELWLMNLHKRKQAAGE